mgnify:CR=1 FL=1
MVIKDIWLPVRVRCHLPPILRHLMVWYVMSISKPSNDILLINVMTGIVTPPMVMVVSVVLCSVTGVIVVKGVSYTIKTL